MRRCLITPSIGQVVKKCPQRHAGGSYHRPCCLVELHGKARRRCGLVARWVLDPACLWLLRVATPAAQQDRVDEAG